MARQHYETLQEVFDDAYRGLAAQGFVQSIGDARGFTAICAYRGRGGRKCAIGQCIPDDQYFAELEGSSPATPALAQGKFFDKLFGRISKDKLVDLQSHHDSWPCPEDMRNALENWALVEGLTIPSIKGAA